MYFSGYICKARLRLSLFCCVNKHFPQNAPIYFTLRTDALAGHREDNYVHIHTWEYDPMAQDEQTYIYEYFGETIR